MSPPIHCYLFTGVIVLLAACGCGPAPQVAAQKSDGQEQGSAAELYVPAAGRSLNAEGAEQTGTLDIPLAVPIGRPDTMAFAIPKPTGDDQPQGEPGGGEADQAVDVPALREALRNRPDDPVTNFRLAAAFRQAGEPARALPYLDRAIELAPGFVEALLERGWLRAERREFTGAEQDFEAALVLVESKAPVHFALASLALRQSRFPEALEQAEKSIASDAEFGSAYIIRGLCRLHAQDQAGARSDLDAARKHVALPQDIELLSKYIASFRPTPAR